MDDVLHQKLIVIDRHTVCCGSHNLSDSALTKNREASLLVRSRKAAAELLEEISTIKVRPVKPPDPGAYIPIPRPFLTNTKYASAMVSAPDNRAFDVYLALWRRRRAAAAEESPLLTVPHEELASELGLDRTMTKEQYRRQINKTLRKLEDRYGLISCSFTAGKPAEVLVRTDLFKTAILREEVLRVPEGYWTYGWYREHGVTTKMVYLMCLLERDASPRRPWWTASQEKLAEKYAIDRFTVNQSLRELEKDDLLHVYRTSALEAGGFDRRKPNTYLLKPLRSPEEIEKAWQHLAELHGKELLETARRIAGLLDCRNKHDVVETVLEWIGRCGAKAVEEETRHVSTTLNADNPYRHFGTMINRLKAREKRGERKKWDEEQKGDK